MSVKKPIKPNGPIGVTVSPRVAEIIEKIMLGIGMIPFLLVVAGFIFIAVVFGIWPTLLDFTKILFAFVSLSGFGNLPSLGEFLQTIFFGSISGIFIGFIRAYSHKRSWIIEETISHIISADTLDPKKIRMATFLLQLLIGLVGAFIVNALGGSLQIHFGSGIYSLHGPLGAVASSLGGAGDGGGPGGENAWIIFQVAAFLVVLFLCVIGSVFIYGNLGLLCGKAVLGGTEGVGKSLGILTAMAITRFWKKGGRLWRFPPDPLPPKRSEPEPRCPNENFLNSYKKWLSEQKIPVTPESAASQLENYIGTGAYKINIITPSDNWMDSQFVQPCQKALALRVANGEESPDPDVDFLKLLDEYVNSTNSLEGISNRRVWAENYLKGLESKGLRPTLENACEEFEVEEKRSLERQNNYALETLRKLPAYLDDLRRWESIPKPAAEKRKRIPFFYNGWFKDALWEGAIGGLVVGIINGIWMTLCMGNHP